MMTQPVCAAVFYPPELGGAPNVKLEQLLIRDIQEHECLVEIVATGLCHTDVAVAGRSRGQFPRVLGHEGMTCNAMNYELIQKLREEFPG